MILGWSCLNNNRVSRRLEIFKARRGGDSKVVRTVPCAALRNLLPLRARLSCTLRTAQRTVRIVIYASLRFLNLKRLLRTCIGHSGGPGPSINATASWTAVAKMHGASLHRRHRFREVKPVLLPQLALQPPSASDNFSFRSCIGVMGRVIRRNSTKVQSSCARIAPFGCFAHMTTKPSAITALGQTQRLCC